MSDSDWTAYSDLTLEERHNASAGSQDISKAECAHAGLPARYLHENPLRDSLGRSHDAVRVHGLVGRNHDKGFAAVTNCRVRQRVSTKCIVANCGEWIVRQLRDVFERCRMVDHFRLVRGEEMVDGGLVRNIAGYGDQRNMRRVRLDFASQ